MSPSSRPLLVAHDSFDENSCSCDQKDVGIQEGGDLVPFVVLALLDIDRVNNSEVMAVKNQVCVFAPRLEKPR